MKFKELPLSGGQRAVHLTVCFSSRRRQLKFTVRDKLAMAREDLAVSGRLQCRSAGRRKRAVPIAADPAAGRETESG